MIFNRPWDPAESMAGPGHVVGQYWWGYDPVWCQRNGDMKGESLCPASDKDPEGSSSMFRVKSADEKEYTKD